MQPMVGDYLRPNQFNLLNEELIMVNCSQWENRPKIKYFLGAYMYFRSDRRKAIKNSDLSML